MESNQNFPDSWAQLRFPEMRCVLMTLLRDLSDVGFQQRVWLVPSNDPRQAFDTLSYALKELIDMRGYDHDDYIDAAIGGELFDSTEVAAVKKLCHLVVAILKDLRKAPAERYFSDSRWPLVVANAKSALELMQGR